MERRPIKSKKRYFLAFIIGSLIFLLVFVITHNLSYVEYQKVTGMQDPLSYKIFQDKLQYTLFGKDICSEEAYLKISQDMGFQGSLIGDLELRLGKDNPDVIFRKKFYSLILLEHFELVKMQNEKCGKNLNRINTILFFYSNDDKDVDKSQRMGDLLSVIAERNKYRLVIYSFDVNLDSDIIRSLKQKYAVNTSYKIIVNENQSFSTIENIKDIEKVFY